MQLPNLSNGGMFNANKKAVLYVFPPNLMSNISDQAHRPFVYNVTPEFLNKASDTSIRSRTGSSGALLENLISSPEAQGIVAPIAIPVANLSMSTVSTLWRFMLMINFEGGMQNGITPFSPMSSRRSIYHGWFTQEPYNPFQGNTANINPQCNMMFTHNTVVEKLSGQYQDHMAERISTRVDDTYLQPSGMLNISSNKDLFMTGPTHSLDAISYNTDGTSWIMPSATQSSLRMMEDGFATIDTNLHNPLNNLRHVTGSIIRTINDVENHKKYNSYNAGFDDGYASITSDTFQDTLTRNMQSRPSTYDNMGPNVHDIWPLEKCMRTYGMDGLELVPTQQTTMFGARDQGEITLANLYSSLICSAAPSIMANMGLMELVFRYTTMRDRNLFNQDDFIIDVATPVMPLSPDELKRRVHYVIGSELKTLAWDQMFMTGGDFEVKASIHCHGLSHVVINFRSDAYLGDAIYESPTVFGGMITPLVGDGVVCSRNAEELNTVINAMFDDSRHQTIGETNLTVPQIGRNITDLFK